MRLLASIALVLSLASCGKPRQAEKPSVLSQVGSFLFRTFTLAVCKEVEDRYVPDAGVSADAGE